MPGLAAVLREVAREMMLDFNAMMCFRRIPVSLTITGAVCVGRSAASGAQVATGFGIYLHLSLGHDFERVLPRALLSTTSIRTAHRDELLDLLRQLDGVTRQVIISWQAETALGAEGGAGDSGDEGPGGGTPGLGQGQKRRRSPPGGGGGVGRRGRGRVE